MPGNAQIRDNDGNYVQVPTDAPEDPGDDYITQDELEDALRNLDLPAPVINEFVTQIAVNETFVTELVTNETYITALTEEQTFIEQTVNEITQVEENNTYIEQITNNNTYISQFNTKINGKKGVANELASLDSGAQLTAAQIPTKLTKRTISVTIGDPNGSVIVAGVKAYVRVPVAWTNIASAAVVCDQSGSISFTVRKATFGTTPSWASIVSSAPPAVSGAIASVDTTLTSWTKTGAAGDLLEIGVSGTPASVKAASLHLELVI